MISLITIIPSFLRTKDLQEQARPPPDLRCSLRNLEKQEMLAFLTVFTLDTSLLLHHFCCLFNPELHCRLASSITGVCRSGGALINSWSLQIMIICTGSCWWCFLLCPLGDAVRLGPRVRARDQATGQIQGPRWNRWGFVYFHTMLSVL